MRAVAVLELAQLHVRRFLRAPDRCRHFLAVPLLLDPCIGSEGAGRRLRRIAIAADACARLDGTATAPLVLCEPIVPIDQDRPLGRELDEADTQRLERDLETLGDGTQDVQVDPLIGDPIAQQIAGHQQVAREVIGLALDGADVVGAGVDARLVTTEVQPLAAMQDEVAQFMSDGEALAFVAGLAIEKIPHSAASFGLRTSMPSQLSMSSTIGVLISRTPAP